MTSSRLINLENSPLVTTLPSGLRIPYVEITSGPDSGSLLITTPPPPYYRPSVTVGIKGKFRHHLLDGAVFKFNGHNRCRQSARSLGFAANQQNSQRGYLPRFEIIRIILSWADHALKSSRYISTNEWRIFAVIPQITFSPYR